MYKYIYADISVLRKILTPKAVYLWIPVQLITFPECKPKEVYIADCFFMQLIDNPYMSVVLLRKVPKPREIRVYDSPPVNVGRIDSQCRDIAKDFSCVVDDIIRGNNDRLYNLMDMIYEYRDVVLTVRHFFFRTKQYTIKGERIRELDRRIAVKVVRDLMHRLCLYDKKENKSLSTSISISKLYTLAYLDPVLQVSGLIIGKNIIEMNTYLNLVKKFQLESLFGVKLQELSSDIHGQTQLRTQL